MDADSSSESDDDFLTIRDKSKGNVDREALIRKKLLENFYGQSTASNSGGEDEFAAESFDDVNKQDAAADRVSSGKYVDTTDVDSPYFDAAGHTSHHVVNSSMHTLLEMDEQLTHQVRTLDSSTQNMVYENYSKFIDATEAVKSVGVNVQANEQGLERLKKGMETINEQSRLVEEDLGSLRDAVAEKIRVKRLLTRLDALLKLPETVNEHIAAGKYRTAASSFCSATTILGKHSAGFESLQKIETECNGIVAGMLKDLKHKILHWSGRVSSLSMNDYNSEDEDHDAASVRGKDDEGNMENNLGDDDDGEPPDPPKTVSEIFECAGTLAIIVKEKPAEFDPGVTWESCQKMSLAACTRLLDRLFDQHHLELQEATYNVGSVEEETFEGDHSTRTQQQKGSHLIPTMVIDSILEAATLYSMTFVESPQGDASQKEDVHLVEFVNETFASFLAHVRMVLLEHSIQAVQHAEDITAEEEQAGDDAYEEVSGAMTILVHSVRELASGLSLPEVGINADLASKLVDKASQLTEAMVRRRVDQKFCDLRLRIVSECLMPFATRVIADDADKDQSKRARVLQVVQVAVSDCLQLLDDTVRSIVSSQDAVGASAASIDLPVLKQSIEDSTRKFASWLGCTLEVLAGCESSDSRFSFEASNLSESRNDERNENVTRKHPSSTAREDMNVLYNEDDPLAEKVDSAVRKLIAEIDGYGDGTASLDFILAVCEMCRGCERAFVDNMNQSIETNVGGGKKTKTSGLFPMDDPRRDRVLSEHERKTTERFRLSASRIISLYASNRGFEAALLLCSDLRNTASVESDDFPKRPRDAVCRVLEVAKLACLDSAELFNESKLAGPIPEFSGTPAITQSRGLGINTLALKGLQLDVERMFKEKVSVYPHPSTIIDLSRNSVLFLLFKVGFKALAEHARNCSFTGNGYNQLLVDSEFLRQMLPHYIKKNYQVDGNNACSSLSILLTEALGNAGERCDDEDCVGNEEFVRSANTVLRSYMKTNVTSSSSFVITED